MGHLVTKRSSHGKAWHVLLFEPDTQRPEWIVVLIPVAVDSAVVVKDSLSLIWIVRFVVSGQCISLTCNMGLIWRGWLNRSNYNTSRVAYIGHVELTTHSHHRNASGATKLVRNTEGNLPVSGVLRHTIDLFVADGKGLFEALKDLG